MAEIEVEKKKPVWPWILLVIVILVIIYFLVFDNNEEVDPVDEFETEEIDGSAALEEDSETDYESELLNDTLAYTGAGVSGFVEYIGDESRMGVDHVYTSTALLYLIDAVRERSTESDWGMDAEVENLREKAQEITKNPEEMQHAGTIKSVGSEIVDLLEDIQEEEFPELEQEVEQARDAVEAIDPEIPTLEQKETVNTFFKEAADILQNI